MLAVMPQFVRWRSTTDREWVAEFSFRGGLIDVSIDDLIRERQTIHSIEWRDQIRRAFEAWPPKALAA